MAKFATANTKLNVLSERKCHILNLKDSEVKSIPENMDGAEVQFIKSHAVKNYR